MKDSVVKATKNLINKLKTSENAVGIICLAVIIVLMLAVTSHTALAYDSHTKNEIGYANHSVEEQIDRAANRYEETVQAIENESESFRNKIEEEEAKAKAKSSYSGSSSGAVYYQNGSGLTKYGGVYSFAGRKETWYSSNVLYHYRTNEWTVDSEGFYRTEEGYYVVAASDMAQGTVFEGSKGMCQVLDSGCASNVTDYYTAF